MSKIIRSIDGKLSKDAMIYVSENEGWFFKLKSCDSLPFLLPALFERPLVLGNPQKKCGAVNYGYNDYEARDGYPSFEKIESLDLKTSIKYSKFSKILVIKNDKIEYLR